MTKDLVNSPSHYAGQGSVECKDLIKVVVSCYEEWEAACVANIIKYIWRCHHKDGLRSLQSSVWYLQEAVEHIAQKSLYNRERLRDKALQSVAEHHLDDTSESLLIAEVFKQMRQNVYNDDEFHYFTVIVNGLKDGGLYSKKSNASEIYEALDCWIELLRKTSLV